MDGGCKRMRCERLTHNKAILRRRTALETHRSEPIGNGKGHIRVINVRHWDTNVCLSGQRMRLCTGLLHFIPGRFVLYALFPERLDKVLERSLFCVNGNRFRYDWRRWNSPFVSSQCVNAFVEKYCSVHSNRKMRNYEPRADSCGKLYTLSRLLNWTDENLQLNSELFCICAINVRYRIP